MEDDYPNSLHPKLNNEPGIGGWIALILFLPIVLTILEGIVRKSDVDQPPEVKEQTEGNLSQKERHVQDRNAARNPGS